MRWQALLEATREREGTPRFVPALGMGLGGGLGEAASGEWTPVRKAVRRAGLSALLAGLGLSRPVPLPGLLRRHRLGARPKPAVFQGGDAQGPSRSAQISQLFLEIPHTLDIWQERGMCFV